MPVACPRMSYFPSMMAVAEPPPAIVDDAVSGTTEDDVSFADEQPLTGPQRVVRALTFWSKVVPILAAYKAVELQGGSEAELEAKYQELHEW